jgi:excisionase family DNA binding protein
VRMFNPFEHVDQRLERIEQILISIVGNEPIKAVIDKPITTRELCEYLGITEPTVIRWRKKGKIPFLQIGSAIRFDKQAVVKALEKKNEKR